MAEVSRRAQLWAELAGEVLAVLLGLWLVVGLGWEELGSALALIGAVGFVATTVRIWTARGEPPVDDDPRRTGRNGDR